MIKRVSILTPEETKSDVDFYAIFDYIAKNKKLHDTKEIVVNVQIFKNKYYLEGFAKMCDSAGIKLKVFESRFADYLDYVCNFSEFVLITDSRNSSYTKVIKLSKIIKFSNTEYDVVWMTQSI